MSDHSWDFIKHWQILVGHCPMTVTVICSPGNGCAPGLVLKQRQTATRKWPISSFNNNTYWFADEEFIIVEAKNLKLRQARGMSTFLASITGLP